MHVVLELWMWDPCVQAPGSRTYRVLYRALSVGSWSLPPVLLVLGSAHTYTSSVPGLW